MAANQSEEIKDLVRQRYGDRARRVIELTPTAPDPSCETGDAGCCSPADTDRALRLYTQAQIDGLPVSAVAASAGCGNPTALAELRPGERVLDLGSGGGIDCFLAAQQVGASGHVIGLDMTPDMLALANRNRDNLGLTNVEFVQGEMEQIPLPESHVNVVISNCVVCLSPDKDAVFRETFPGAGPRRTHPHIGHDVPDRRRPGPHRRRSLGLLRRRRRTPGHLPATPPQRRIR